MRYFLFILIFGISSIASFSQYYDGSTVYFPVTHHIITRDNGTGGMNVSEIPLIMAELNRAFAPAKIQFYMSCKGIDTIRSTAKYDFVFGNGSWYSNNTTFEDAERYLTDTVAEPHTINIYYANSIKVYNNGFPFDKFEFVDGCTQFPWDPGDFIIVVKTGSGSGYPITSMKRFGLHIHEMGHFFGLQHTFLNYNDVNLSERPGFMETGPFPCNKTGDSLCCTPADIVQPLGNSYYYNIYIDSNGCEICYLKQDPFYYNPLFHQGLDPDSVYWYSPDLKNYMSYTSPVCWEHFSDGGGRLHHGQNYKMRNLAVTNSKLFSKIGKPSAIRLKTGISNTFDTLFASADYCNGNFSTPPDTIYYRDESGNEKCLSEKSSNKIYFPSDMTILESAIWYVNGDSVQTGTLKFGGDDYYFPLSDFRALWVRPDYTSTHITIKAVLPNGKEFVFKFRIGNCGDCDEIRVGLCCVCGFTPFGGNWPDITMIGTTWRYGIHICNADKDNPITNIRVTPLSNTHIFDSVKVDLETGKVDVYFTCDANQPTSYLIPMEICVDFEDGTTCCKMHEETIICGAEYYILPLNVTPNPVDDIATIGYKIFGMQKGLRLKIDIYDERGSLVLNVMDGYPISAIDEISIITSGLSPGRYYVVFRYGNFINSTAFIKQ